MDEGLGVVPEGEESDGQETGTLIIGLYGGQGGGSVTLFFFFPSFCSGQLSENDISV